MKTKTVLVIESPAASCEQHIEIYSPNGSIFEDVFHRSSDSPSAEQIQTGKYATSMMQQLSNDISH
ncbi:hypothetical protein AKO1_012643 [Acrasis kona]|uniref:Uncharacterized protein n=1 Tax=Acrasis kona TaxID=1008807 RepID=A0AAW2YW74_9EUKA